MIERDEITRANEAHVAPSCPVCKHHNAMLYDGVHNYETNEAKLKCRDCGHIELISRNDLPHFC